jgi:UDP-N-acetylmuramoyl-L-alanine---L-glutamate ligase
LPNSPAGLASLHGAKVLIAGTGREALAIATRLRDLDSQTRIVAIDGHDGESAAAWRDRFGQSIPLHIIQPDGGEIPAEVLGCEVAVVSPGIPKTGFLHAIIRGLGVRVTSGSALFVADHADTMVGVTGSKGKSTTSTLLHHLLAGSGHDVSLAGNMGIPVQAIEPSDYQVVEFSSYQCSYLETSPRTVVLTALFPEHLDWHGSIDAYYGDKLLIMGGNPEHVIANSDDPILVDQIRQRYPDVSVTWVGKNQVWHTEDDGQGGSWLMRGDTRLAHSSDVPLLGRHNQHNALLGIAGADATGLLDISLLPQLLRSVKPLAHRLEVIEDPSGVVFVNDSLATNPQAAIAALGALQDKRVIVLLGGHDRGVDYQPLIDQIVSHPPLAVLGLPQSGQRLVELCGEALAVANKTGVVHLSAVDSMEQALVQARTLAQPGDYVVLSPGAPSFGQYRDFQHRAEDFMANIVATRGITP